MIRINQNKTTVFELLLNSKIEFFMKSKNNFKKNLYLRNKKMEKIDNIDNFFNDIPDDYKMDVINSYLNYKTKLT